VHPNSLCALLHAAHAYSLIVWFMHIQFVRCFVPLTSITHTHMHIRTYTANTVACSMPNACRGARLLFLRSGGVGLLPPLLRASNNPSNSQLLYELALCVWQLSFHKEAADALGAAGASKQDVACCLCRVGGYGRVKGGLRVCVRVLGWGGGFWIVMCWCREAWSPWP
jgi:hypothetical protein